MKKFEFMMKSMTFGVLMLALVACTETSSSPSSTGSDVAIRTELDNAVAHSAIVKGKQISLGSSSSNVDSLQVTDAAFVVSNFMVRSDVSDEQSSNDLAMGFIRQEQFLLCFNVLGRQYIGEHTLYSATYRSARFDIHPLVGSSDSLVLALGPTYLSLFGQSTTTPSSATILINGYVWKDGMKMPFTYRSNTTGGGRILFSTPIQVTSDSPQELIVRFHSSTVFTDGSGGLMDPREPGNAAAIDEHLKLSLQGDVSGGTR